MSAIVPPPSVKGADPAQPARNRNAINMSIEFESAQAILNITKRTLVMLSRFKDTTSAYIQKSISYSDIAYTTASAHRVRTWVR